MSVVWVILATAVVVLLAVLTTFAIQTLVEIRAAVRELRMTVTRLTPDVEATLANTRRASETIVRAGEALEHSPVAEGIHGLASRAKGRTPLAVGLVTALKLGRWFFSGRRRADKEKKR